MSKKVKIFIGIVLGIAALIAGISFLGGSDPVDVGTTPMPNSTGGTLSTTAIPGGAPGAMMPGQTGAAANEFAGLLSNINTITIDTSIFQNPAYKALRDYPVLLGTDVIGRINPFAPIGSDSGATTVTESLSVQTLAAGKVTATSAELGALVTLPDTANSSVVFQYGVSDTFGTSTTPVTITKTGTTLSTITGLTAGTKYFVQAVVVRGSSTTLGGVINFTTTAPVAR